MYKVVFGWLKRGGVPTGAELLALYQLMIPVFKMMKVRRPPVSDVDDRLLKIYAPLYEYWALRTSRPDDYWKGLGQSFTEVKALRTLREEVKRLVAELYPPKPRKKEKAAPKPKVKK